MAIEIVGVGEDLELVRQAAIFKASRKMAYADCFAAALAKLNSDDFMARNHATMLLLRVQSTNEAAISKILADIPPGVDSGQHQVGAAIAEQMLHRQHYTIGWRAVDGVAPRRHLRHAQWPPRRQRVAGGALFEFRCDDPDIGRKVVCDLLQ